jgi:hypothetical protein
MAGLEKTTWGPRAPGKTQPLARWLVVAGTASGHPLDGLVTSTAAPRGWKSLRTFAEFKPAEFTPATCQRGVVARLWRLEGDALQ